MKKLFLTLGIACLFMVACNNAPKQEATEEPVAEEVTPAEEEHVCPMAALKEGLANWENLAEEERVELINSIKALFDEKDAAMAEGNGCCQHAEGEIAEMTEEMKAACEAKHAQMQALMERWANWAEMSIEEQKALIEERFAAMTCCQHAEEGECNAEAEAPVEE